MLTVEALIAGSLLVAVSIISIAVGILTLRLISVLNRSNGYMRLIWSLTICQIIYDFSFLFYAVGYAFSNKFCQGVSLFVSTFGGLSVSFWTNILILVVTYMVYSLRTVDVVGNYWRAVLFAVIIPIVFACLTLVALHDKGYFIENDVYNILRIASIVLNVILYIYIYWKLNLFSPGAEDRSSKALRVLVSRLKYYPICQVITRIWPSAYELYYGYQSTGFSEPTSLSDNIILYGYSLFLPSAGIGYFFVFLLMQPDAYVCCKKLLLDFFCCRGKAKAAEDSVSGANSASSRMELEDESIYRTSASMNSEYSLGSHDSSMQSIPLTVLERWDESQLEHEIERQYSTANKVTTLESNLL